MKLYVARHGQTLWNLQDRVCGRTDLPLTDIGLRQARELAEQLAPLPICRILCSPLQRARQTAAPAAEQLGLPIEIEPRLIEQDYGTFEGTDRFASAFLQAKGQLAYRMPGGESAMRIAQRVYNLLDELEGSDGVLLVCHNGICRIIHTYFFDLTNDEFPHYQMDNAGWRAYEWADRA